MSTTLRESLARGIQSAAVPDLDLAALIEVGEHRLRRRRLVGVLGSVAAVVVVLAVALSAALNSPVRRGQQPVDHPRPTPDRAVAQPVRKVVYNDTSLFRHTAGAVHYGDRLVATSDAFIHLDVTDDGFVYTTRGGRVWFSNGGATIQIGTACGFAPNRQISTMSSRLVMTANAGSQVAWFDCRARPGARPDLVVFDTGSSREVARREVPCRYFCTLVGLTVDQVYFDGGYYRGHPRAEHRLDVSTGRLVTTTPRLRATDIRSHPRGVVVGDSWQSGTATDGIGVEFRAEGSRLSPVRVAYGPDLAGGSVFDTGTKGLVQLRLPEGYRSRSDLRFTLFEWLDDDTVALVGGGLGNGLQDILTCRLSDGSCVVAVPGDDMHDRRTVPNMDLPG
jgi:hypothetical protein